MAWYPFNGNANDESGNGNDGTVVGASATIDRDGNLNSALEFLGAPVPGTDRTEVAVDNHVAVPNFGEGFENGISISLWSEVYPTSESAFLQRRNNNNIDFSLELNNSQQPGVHLGFMALGSTSSIVNEWTHIALSYDEQTVQLFKNGMLIASEPSTQNINSYDDLLLIGKYIYYGGNTHHFFFNGKQDDIGIWNRALTEEEILALYNAELPIPGCTDSNACNFNPEATGDDGSCVYPPSESVDCEFGGNYCGDGTAWDSSLQICVGFDDCPADLNGNGLVEVSDLLMVLADFGTECPPVTAETCGDPVNYQGYDYATVQIGEQCWFAENLRSTSYSNGDEIPGELDDSNWSATTLGARTVYGEGSSTVQNGSGDETLNLTNYGRLYNAYAVDDNRGLCPNDWHVPIHADWATLEIELGMSEVEANATGWRGSDQGSQLKASSSDTPSWNGTNSSQFSGLPGGYRSYLGNMVSADLYGVFWCQEMNQKMLGGIYDQVYSVVYTEEHFNRGGYSVRCVRD